MLTLFGACVVTFMMLMYALEGRGRRFVLAFAVGCALSSTYGFLAGTWPFGIVEGIWSLVAVKRYLDQRLTRSGVPAPPPAVRRNRGRRGAPRWAAGCVRARALRRRV